MASVLSVGGAGAGGEAADHGSPVGADVATAASQDLGRVFDWTVGTWQGTRRDGADGTKAPMTMRVESILGGVGQLRQIEVHDGASVYQGIAVQIPDRERGRWVRQYTNGLYGTFATLVGTVEGTTSTWTSETLKRPKRSSLLSERLVDGTWRRTMRLSEDDGASWHVLWVDEMRSVGERGRGPATTPTSPPSP